MASNLEINALIELNGLLREARELVTERRPITVTPSTGDSLLVFCSDGAVFRRHRDGSWRELSSVPGTPRSREK